MKTLVNALGRVFCIAANLLTTGSVMNNYEPQYSRRQQISTPWAVFILTVLGTVLAGVILWNLGLISSGRQPPAPHNPTVKQREPAPRTDRDPDEIERINLYKSVKPSVVNVDTLASASGGVLRDEETSLGTGSGFFWDDDGRIVTNFHVLRDALALDDQDQVVIHPDRKILVTLASGESILVRLVGVAPDQDLGVIQLTRLPKTIYKMAVGTSNDLEVGQSVYAIGNPFGQRSTFTRGIISALNRSIQSPTQHIISGVIQTDAALNPGNSGGPLLDKDGRLIGVTAAITSPSGGSVGLGYAIPVDTVNRVVTELIQNGRTAQPYIGAEYVLEEAYIRRMGITSGVVIRKIAPRSPAETAGLQPGDIIVKVNGTDTAGLTQLEQVLNNVKIGDMLTFTIRRKKQEFDVSVRVEGI